METFHLCRAWRNAQVSDTAGWWATDEECTDGVPGETPGSSTLLTKITVDSFVVEQLIAGSCFWGCPLPLVWLKTYNQLWHHSFCENHWLLLVLLPVLSICLWLCIQLHQWVNSTWKGFTTLLLQTNFSDLQRFIRCIMSKKSSRGRYHSKALPGSSGGWGASVLYSRKCLTFFCHCKGYECYRHLKSPCSFGLGGKLVCPNWLTSHLRPRSCVHRMVDHKCAGDMEMPVS